MEKPFQQPDINGGEELPQLAASLSKREIAAKADEHVTALLEDGDVFRMAEALAVMEDFVKSVRRDDRYVQYLRDELAKHGGWLLTASGARIERCESGVSYDYSANAEWCALEEEIARLTAEKKALEERLKSIAPGRIGVDPETGEVIEGALKSSRSTYRITLPR